MLDCFLDLENEFLDFKNMRRKSKRALIIYGSGMLAKQAYEYLKSEKIDIECFCETKKAKEIYLGKNNFSYEEVNKIYNRADILIASSFYEEIENIIDKNKFKVYNFSRNSYGQFNIFYFETLFLKKNKIKFENVLNKLEDDRSKNIYMNEIKHRITGDMELIKRIKSENVMYFDKDIYKVSDDENILDIGAFNGDTLKEYINLNKEIKGKYFCFEPDKWNFSQLNKYKLENKIDNIKLFNLGVWSENTIVKFNEGNLDESRIGSSGNRKVECVKLDSIEFNERISIVKMDIEGAELNALKGMVNLIKRDRPILAISIYHLKEHLFEIPLFLFKILEEYKFYVRHYSKFCYDTVLYAIPNERSEE